jgi:hypothetical protein
MVGERLAGAAAVLLVVGGAVGSTALPAWPLARTPALRALFVAVVVVWVGSMGYPPLRAALPGRTLGEARLTAAQPSAKLHVDGNGPFEVSVGGNFKQAGGEAEAPYTIKVDGGGHSDEVSGAIKREVQHVRTSRRGGTSTQIVERTEYLHRLASAAGSELTLTADGVDEQLDNGLFVEVRAAGPNPLFFYLLGALAVLGAVALDSQLTDLKGKLKSYLAVGAGLCYVFAIYLPLNATPHSLVRPAVGGLFAGMGGAAGGWLLGAIARALFGPKLKKKTR